LNKVPASLIDGVSDVCVEFVGVSAFDVAQILWAAKPSAALVAILAAQMILVAAAAASSGHLPARHCNKWTVGSFDDFQITDHETLIDRNRTEGAEPILGILHQLDSNLGDFHRFPHSILDQQRLAMGIAPLRSA
jgi:hypothetical protein